MCGADVTAGPVLALAGALWFVATVLAGGLAGLLVAEAPGLSVGAAVPVSPVAAGGLLAPVVPWGPLAPVVAGAVVLSVAAVPSGEAGGAGWPGSLAWNQLSNTWPIAVGAPS
jgi:hypothetical protein